MISSPCKFLNVLLQAASSCQNLCHTEIQGLLSNKQGQLQFKSVVLWNRTLRRVFFPSFFWTEVCCCLLKLNVIFLIWGNFDLPISSPRQTHLTGWGCLVFRKNEHVWEKLRSLHGYGLVTSRRDALESLRVVTMQTPKEDGGVANICHSQAPLVFSVQDRNYSRTQVSPHLCIQCWKPTVSSISLLFPGCLGRFMQSLSSSYSSSTSAAYTEIKWKMNSILITCCEDWITIVICVYMQS